MSFYDFEYYSYVERYVEFIIDLMLLKFKLVKEFSQELFEI